MTHAMVRASSHEGGRVGVTLVQSGGGESVISDATAVIVEIDRRPLTRWRQPVLTQDENTVVIDGVLAGSADGTALNATWRARRIAGQAVWEFGLVLRNDSSEPVTITRMDPLSLVLADHGRAASNDTDGSSGVWQSHSFSSAWGDEFRPASSHTGHDLVLESRSGRSSHGTIPWLGLEQAAADQTGRAITIAPAWSGNWHIHAMAGGVISAGISPWQFFVKLEPGQSVTAPSVVLTVASDLDAASVALQRAVAADWLPRTTFTDTVSVEWNHWWPYEDQEVTEQIIADNARAANDLGIEIATVDAGWFGSADAASDWQEQRGDWATVNTERFPSGLAGLGDSIRAAGAKPGMWIEAEAVGASARLRAEHPELLALALDGRRHDPSYRLMTVSLDADDHRFLGYVCLGSAEGRTHVLESMSRLISETGARWIKLDFNIDPDAGCTRTDHGHGAGDGLLRHYEGLYTVLDEVRARHPEIMLESCSSGGLRIDLGLAKHVHGFFLSDPDYTEHHLEVLSGATRLLPPIGILHWSWSQWRGDYPPSKLDWAKLGVDEFDTMLRAAMLHRFGVSIRLIELRPELYERLRVHVALFKQLLAPLVRDGVLLALTPPPERGGFGERAPSYQLSVAAVPTVAGARTAVGDRTAGGDQHVVATFVLEGGTRPDSVTVRGLDGSVNYSVTDLATGVERLVSGAELIKRGIPLDGSPRVTSWLQLIQQTA
ncbi:MAG: alpha-galactosidase [Salinibacterium sp.]|nr:alpha-galactosidase [Salinibacterium sp.]